MSIKKRLGGIFLFAVLAFCLGAAFSGCKSVEESGTETASVEYGDLYGIHPIKDDAGMLAEISTTTVPSVVSLRPQQIRPSFEKNGLRLEARYKVTARPRQANEITTTFCHQNVYPIDYFIYCQQKIRI